MVHEEFIFVLWRLRPLSKIYITKCICILFEQKCSDMFCRKVTGRFTVPFIGVFTAQNITDVEERMKGG